MTGSHRTWLDDLHREAGYRRLIVLSGNVNDPVQLPQTGEVQPAHLAVEQALRTRGFEEVLVWNRATGIEGSAGVWNQLRAGAAGAPAESTGEAYDVPGVDPSPPAQRADPEEMCAVASHLLTHRTRQPTALVIDAGHLLFGHAAQSSEVERQWLTRLVLAVRRSETDVYERERPQNLVLFVCGRQSALPLVVQSEDSAAAHIAVPQPSRQARARFLATHRDHFLVTPALQPSTPSFEAFVDALDGLTIRDLQQLARLSRQESGVPTPEGLVHLYRYGEPVSPWESLNRMRLRHINAELGTRVKGQDQAIERVRQVVIRAFTGLSGIHHSRRQNSPKGVLFFVGPTGVGKTELAKALAQFLFGDEEACIRFDMSEFNHEHADQRLVGAPPGYIGHEQGGQLTNAVLARPFSVLLFDEIEKAHNKILDKFLQILEDGRLTDGRGQTVHFSETIIIFTSNIGAAKVRATEDDAEARHAFCQHVRHHFVDKLGRPELLNRIGDNIVPFNFIRDAEFLTRIAQAKLIPIREKLTDKYGLQSLEFDDEAAALTDLLRHMDVNHGGRGVQNVLQRKLIDPLAEFLFTELENDQDATGQTLRAHRVGDTGSFIFRLEAPC